MKKLHVGIVGLGGIGKGQVETLRNSPHVERITVFDTNQEAVRYAVQTYGIQAADSFDGMLDDGSLDLVYIATPGAIHARLAVPALRAGKAVMSEKPMATTLEDCEKMLRAAKETGTFLQIGFECRYSKLYLRMKEILESGEIGELKNIMLVYVASPWPDAENPRWRWRYDPKRSGGLYCEKLCHYVDLPRWWVGSRITRFFAESADTTLPYYGIRDNSYLTYKFENGVTSQLNFLMGPAHYPDGPVEDIADQREDGHKLLYVLSGTMGAVEGNVFYRQMRVFHHAGTPGINSSKLVRVETWKKDQDHFYFHNTTDQNLDIARRVAEGLPPYTPPEDSLETMRLSFKVQEATGSWQVVEM